MREVETDYHGEEVKERELTLKLCKFTYLTRQRERRRKRTGKPDGRVDGKWKEKTK